jgi:ABC-type nitrate/sulfonate/bicarbonate transport system permease component
MTATSGIRSMPASESALARLAASPLAVRLAAGLALLAVWEFGVRAWAPAYVARPTGVAAVFWSVATSREFLVATGATLASVAEGLAIALLAGVATGIAMGRSIAVDRLIR